MERRILPWMAKRLPIWIKPDHLTVIGLLSSLLIGASYWMTTFSYDWLWLVNFGFFANWWADSLDGTLARVRHIERERYGFFVDHYSDTIGQFLIILGMGLSPIMDLRISLLLITTYYCMSILVYLVSITRGVFKISFVGIGPTETRLIIVIVNIIVWYLNNPQIIIGHWELTIFNIVGMGGSIIMIMLYLIFGVIERHKLAIIDPPKSTDFQN